MDFGNLFTDLCEVNSNEVERRTRDIATAADWAERYNFSSSQIPRPYSTRKLHPAVQTY